jgi:hypothetical protein
MKVKELQEMLSSLDPYSDIIVSTDYGNLLINEDEIFEEDGTVFLKTYSESDIE